MEIIGPILGFLGKIISALIGKDLLKIKKRKREVLSGRKRAIEGKWSGSIRQKQGYDAKGKEIFEPEYPVTFFFEIDSGVKGEITVDDDDQHGRLVFEGDFYEGDGRFIKLTYEEQDERIVRFGSAVLDISRDGKIIHGVFCGVGHLSNNLITGEFTLKKIA